jgi:hypothetical protein
MGGPSLILLILLILNYPNLSYLSQWSKFPDEVHQPGVIVCLVLQLGQDLGG